MADYVPDDSKKQPLFEIFRAAVWSPLVGDEDVTTAVDAGRKAGVTDQDIETMAGWDAKQLKGYFGEAAINRDLVNAMKATDAMVSGMGRAFGYGSAPEFKSKGFY